MANRRILVACVVGLMGCALERHAHAQERPSCGQRALSVTVRLHNNAGVPADLLASAKAYTTEAYRRISVALQWLDGRDAVYEDVGTPYTVVLMTPQAAQRKATEDGITDDVVGQAAAVARRAYIYYERVVGLALPPDRDLVTFLGYVMAHELGHLMLPGRRHSAAGIMRAGFPSSSRSIETFTAADAAAICARLEHEAKRHPSIGQSAIVNQH